MLARSRTPAGDSLWRKLLWEAVMNHSDTPRRGIHGTMVRRLAATTTCLLFALAGCTSPAAPAAPPPAEGSSPSASGVSPSVAASGSSAPTSPVPSAPAPSATGTWTPPPSQAPVGPRTAAPVPTKSAPLTEPVTFDTAAVVSLTSVAAITVTAETPGEVNGPAVKVTVRVENRSAHPIDLSSAVVSLSADRGGFGIPTTAGGPVPLAGELAAGASGSGSYVFMLDPASGRMVTVSVNYSAAQPIAVFTGKVD